MSDLRDAAELALTALENTCPNNWTSVKENLRKALAQPEPVHASDMSQERVDETAKSGHEFFCPRCGHCCQQREWVGMDGDIPGLGLVTEEFYNGMLCAEDILRKRNT